MIKLLPWVCVAGLVIGLGWVYLAGQKKDAELAVLREESQQLQKLRAEQEDAKNARAKTESEELSRLRREHDELLRLRNEVSRLRGEKQQLATQMQTAQAQVQTAQAQAQSAQAQAQALRTNPGQANIPPQILAQAQANICINNLRVIDGAKEQWALEKQKPRGALLTAVDLSPYLKSNTLPVCPAGGAYSLNPIGYPPTCSVPGHTLQK